MTVPVAPVARIAGKGAQPATIQRLRDAEDEVSALTAERHDLGLRIGYFSRIAWRAAWSERYDLVLELAGELDRLSGRLIARGQS